MSRRIRGVITSAAAASNGGLDWDFALDLCPWRADGGPVSRESVRILIPMKNQAAATRMWLAWDGSAGATVALGLERLELPSKSVPYAYGYGRLPVRRTEDDPEMKKVVREETRRRKRTLEVPGLGVLTRNGDAGHLSKTIRVPALGRRCRVALEEYEGDPRPKDFHVAIANFFSRDRSVLTDAQRHVFRYYEDCRDHGGTDEKGFPRIPSPRDVWAHVRFGGELTVSRDDGDKRVYVSLECSCDWEREHGLQLVFRNGLRITKVGPFDGHLTNAAARGKKGADNIVYRSRV
jgi:hypothetical protein